MNVNEKETTLTRAGSAATRKLVLTAMFTCLTFVLNTFVYFPAMAPFQHFVNVLAAALVGPWYGSAAGFLCGVLRMLCGRDIGCITGAMFGPILGGLLYRKFGTWWSVWIGEIIGTGVIGAMAGKYTKVFSTKARHVNMAVSTSLRVAALPARVRVVSFSFAFIVYHSSFIIAQEQRWF